MEKINLCLVRGWIKGFGDWVINLGVDMLLGAFFMGSFFVRSRDGYPLSLFFVCYFSFSSLVFPVSFGTYWADVFKVQVIVLLLVCCLVGCCCSDFFGGCWSCCLLAGESQVAEAVVDLFFLFTTSLYSLILSCHSLVLVWVLVLLVLLVLLISWFSWGWLFWGWSSPCDPPVNISNNEVVFSPLLLSAEGCRTSEYRGSHLTQQEGIISVLEV